MMISMDINLNEHCSMMISMESNGLMSIVESKFIDNLISGRIRIKSEKIRLGFREGNG